MSFDILNVDSSQYYKGAELPDNGVVVKVISFVVEEKYDHEKEESIPGSNQMVLLMDEYTDEGDQRKFKLNKTQKGDWVKIISSKNIPFETAAFDFTPEQKDAINDKNQELLHTYLRDVGVTLDLFPGKTHKGKTINMREVKTVVASTPVERTTIPV